MRGDCLSARCQRFLQTAARQMRATSASAVLGWQRAPSLHPEQEPAGLMVRTNTPTQGDNEHTEGDYCVLGSVSTSKLL